MINTIKEPFNKVISYSQGIPMQELHTEDLLKQWHKAKKPIMDKFFQGQMIYRYPEPVRFELDTCVKNNLLSDYVNYVDMLLGFDHPLVTFLTHITSKEFFDNRLEKEYKVSDDKTICAGTKVIKAFKYFITNNILLDDLQTRASCLIQENKIEGYLSFSVHPLDYLSSSENTFNWRSCHALDGEYRAGNLSYMCDPSTVICYLSGKDDTKLPGFPLDVPWNSKKWRCLLHFDRTYSVVFAGRQYPFNAPGALETLREIFYECCVPADRYGYWREEPLKPEWSHWHNDYLNSFEYSEFTSDDYFEVLQNSYFMINGNIYDINKVVVDADNSKHFNDLLRSSYYIKPYYMYEKQFNRPEHLVFTIGHPVKCLVCGEDYIWNDSTMLCPACGGEDEPEQCHCDSCGCYFDEEDGYWVGDEYLCPQCAEEHAFVCADCGMRHWNENKRFDEVTSEFVCIDCYEKRKEKRNG